MPCFRFGCVKLGFKIFLVVCKDEKMRKKRGLPSEASGISFLGNYCLISRAFSKRDLLVFCVSLKNEGFMV